MIRGWPAVSAIVAVTAVIHAALLLAPAHAAADVTHYKYWARLVAFEGVSGSYSGTYPETGAIYPPVTMYGYWLVGSAYRLVVDPEFDMDRALGSRLLTIAVKLVAVVPHVLSIPLIYAMLRTRARDAVALGLTAAYALNPAALFDFAFWGQPDGIHSVFLAITAFWIERDRPRLAGAALGLALATKPQAWALAPFLGYVALRRFGIRGCVHGGVMSALAFSVACLPFIVNGTLGDLPKLPRWIVETMPVASANAHNIWWLFTEARPEFVADTASVFGEVTIRQFALLLAAIVLAVGCYVVNWRSRAGGIAGVAAFVALGWFMVTTRAHENHGYFVLPLLILAAARSRGYAMLFLLLSITFAVNMVIHDFGLRELRVDLMSPEMETRLQLANAGINALVLVGWAVWLLSRPQVDDGAGEAGQQRGDERVAVSHR